MAREQQRLKQTRILATMSGLVSIRQNSFGGERRFGSQVPDLREGDQVQPGMPVADVLDLSELDVLAKIGELDRANLTEGQEALIELDALAGKKVRGRIKSMSGTASANVFSGDPSKKFDVRLLGGYERAAHYRGSDSGADSRSAGDGRKKPQQAGESSPSVFRLDDGRLAGYGGRDGRRAGGRA